MARTIDYGNLMHAAMRGLIQKVLSDVEREGLPGEHHFFITFDTRHPDAELAPWLAERFPENMTIVMQHWYDGLDVRADGFAITLNFGDNPEPLFIPYDAIQTFVDPSVEFGLRFETQEPVQDDEAGEEPAPESFDPREALKNLQGASARENVQEEEDSRAGDDSRPDAEVVSLDKFRK